MSGKPNEMYNGKKAALYTEWLVQQSCNSNDILTAWCEKIRKKVASYMYISGLGQDCYFRC